MPGRFQHLEFESGDEKHRQALRSAARTEHRAQERTARGTPVQDASACYARAVEAGQWGLFEKSLQLHTRALKDDPKLVPAWVGQVQMLVQLGEHHEARLWADKALELFRNQGDLLAAKAQACARLADLPAAFACSDASLQSPGSSPGRWQARGEVLLARREGRAAECFEKALAEPAADWFDRVVSARIHLYYRQTAQALHLARQALELRPDHGYNWFVLGQCQAALGVGGAAQASFARCLELAPTYAPATVALRELLDQPWPRRAWRRLCGWRHR